MKQFCFLLLLFVVIQVHAQENKNEDVMAIRHQIDRFFLSLANQDTLMMQEVAEPDGQIWTLNNIRQPSRRRMRYSREDYKSFDPDEQLQETPLDYVIKAKNGIAMAWVPYEFRVNGEFSHCGVDVFTLIKTEGTWKITTMAYTIDESGCDSD